MPKTPSSRTLAPLCAALLILTLGACGQKGALYHPDPADAAARPSDPATPAKPSDKKKDPATPPGAPR